MAAPPGFRPVPPVPDPNPAPADADPTADAAEAADHGRIGYGRRGRWTPLALALGLIVALLLIGLAGQRRGEEETPSALGEARRASGALVGRPAPDVTLRLFDGGTLRLADLRGATVVVNFWASWCGPCRDELPAFQALADEAERTGAPLRVVGVGLKARDSDEAARAFARDLGATYPLGRDTGGADPARGPIELAFGIPPYLPLTLVLAPDGTVAAAHVGELDGDGIRDLVAKAG